MEIISILFKSWHYLIEINLILFILALSFSHFLQSFCEFVCVCSQHVFHFDSEPNEDTFESA